MHFDSEYSRRHFCEVQLAWGPKAKLLCNGTEGNVAG